MAIIKGAEYNKPMSKFKHIGIIARISITGVTETLSNLINVLNEKNISFCIEEETASLIEGYQGEVFSKTSLGEHCDLVIVIGGDGSLLSAAHHTVNNNVPILGINRGKLGFLTDIHPSELQSQLENILSGKYTTEERFLITAYIEHNNNTIKSHALNEVALLAEKVPHLIEFEIFIDDQFVCSQRSDGLIIATPTGSTAYALSGGGPILHPALDAIVLVPMFPHTLSLRPIVLNGGSHITIKIAESNMTPLVASCDGQNHIPIEQGAAISIQKKQQT